MRYVLFVILSLMVGCVPFQLQSQTPPAPLTTEEPHPNPAYPSPSDPPSIPLVSASQPPVWIAAANSNPPSVPNPPVPVTPPLVLPPAGDVATPIAASSTDPYSWITSNAQVVGSQPPMLAMTPPADTGSLDVVRPGWNWGWGFALNVDYSINAPARTGPLPPLQNGFEHAPIQSAPVVPFVAERQVTVAAVQNEAAPHLTTSVVQNEAQSRVLATSAQAAVEKHLAASALPKAITSSILMRTLVAHAGPALAATGHVAGALAKVLIKVIAHH